MQNFELETSVLSGSSRMSSSRPTKPEIDNNRYNKEDQKIDQNMVLVQRDAKMEQRKLFPKPVEQAALVSKVFNQLQTEGFIQSEYYIIKVTYILIQIKLNVIWP